jgi:hypothetical protein
MVEENPTCLHPALASGHIKSVITGRTRLVDMASRLPGVGVSSFPRVVRGTLGRFLIPKVLSFALCICIAFRVVGSIALIRISSSCGIGSALTDRVHLLRALVV